MPISNEELIKLTSYLLAKEEPKSEVTISSLLKANALLYLKIGELKNQLREIKVILEDHYDGTPDSGLSWMGNMIGEIERAL